MKARTIITVCVALLRPHEQENDSWIPLAIESDSVVPQRSQSYFRLIEFFLTVVLGRIERN
jgi:hypothetical protein